APPGIEPYGNCFFSINDCPDLCSGLAFNCHAVNDSCVDGGVVPGDGGSIDIDCSICSNGIGRLPAGLLPAHMPRAPSAVAEYWARAAHLEAASVHAFERLHDELAAHGAPTGLLRATRRAAADERRHARVVGAMALRLGGQPVPPRLARPRRRSLAAL